jgi:PelA/Pel-15E family pectate lyase
MDAESMRTSLALISLPVAFAAAAAAYVTIGVSTPAPPLTPERIAALPRAQQAVWQAYLERSNRQRLADRAAFDAELKKSGLASALVPANGNGVGRLLNRPGEWFAGEEASRFADFVVSFQTPAGGWSKNVNLTDHARRAGESFAPNNSSTHLAPGDFDAPHDLQWNYIGTLDNDATTTEMRFLAKTAAAAKDPERYRAAFLRGLDYLFAAQFPNGGWPQIWPLEGSYHDAVTFNDGAAIKAINLLQDVADGKNEFAFVSASARTKARGAVKKGLECILAAQIVHDGRRTVWGQQHDSLSLLPVAGRNYEPAAQSSSESAAVCVFLMRMERPDAAVVNAVHAAAAWFRKTAIYGKAYRNTAEDRVLVDAPGAGPLWARYYEIGTDRPIFGDRDKSIHDDVTELSFERRTGYSWYNAGAQQALDRYAEWSAAHPQK